MRIIKKLIIYTTIIGASVFSILVVFGFLYQDEVVSAVSTELNKHLNAEIKVEKIELSFISHFPQATINLNGVVGFESKNYTSTPDTLFAFKRFSLSFNVLDVLRGSYVLHQMEASDGFLNLERDANGRGNYEIFKSDTSKDSSFELDLEGVILNHCVVGYHDFNKPDKFKFQFPHIIAKGSITDTQISAALYGKVQVIDLILDRTSYLNGELSQVDIGVEINTETGSVLVTRGKVVLRDQFTFEVKGKTDAKKFHYTFEGSKLDLAQLESLIPKRHGRFIQSYEMSGALDFFLDIERSNSAKRPRIEGNFMLRDGRLKYVKTGEWVQITKAKGTFDLGSLAAPQTTTIDIPSFNVITNEGEANGAFKLNNFIHPKYEMEITGSADLKEVSKLADMGSFEMSGMADFKFKVKGSIQQIDSMQLMDLKSIKGLAEIALKDASFLIKDMPLMAQVNSTIQIDKERIHITDFKGLISESVTHGNITIANWLDYLFDANEILKITGNMQTDKFDMAQWTKEKPSVENSDFALPKNFTFIGKVGIKEFKHKALLLRDIDAFVQYKYPVLILNDAYFKAFNGTVFTQFKMIQYANGWVYSGQVKTQNVQMENLMSTFNNFGQSEFTSDHLRGKLNSNLVFKFSTDQKFNVDEKSVFVDGDVVLLDGELIEYKLLTDIPKEIESNKVIALFVNLDRFEKRLHHIKFDTISNHIHVENRMISIPSMEINSTALGISLNGKHSFDNDLDYYLSFNLNDVVGKKEPITSEYGFIEDDGRGNRKLYLHVYTKNGEVEVDVDKLGAKQKWNRVASEELNTAKAILKQELGLFKSDSNVVIPDAEPSFEYDVDLGEFGDPVKTDSAAVIDSEGTSADSTRLGKLLKKAKKKKKKKDDFEEWDFEDDDF